MQDKTTIADAPDCLNTNDKAMWVLGYEAAIEARGQCLHQIQEPAAADVLTSGAAALSEYLKTCEQHAIVPDIGGAFASAFTAGFNLSASQAALPKSEYLEGVNIPNLREALIFLGRENGVGEGEVGDKLAQYVNSVVSGVLSKKATLREADKAAPDETQIKALMRRHRIWIEHSTLFEDDEPPRELRAVQAEQHQFEVFVQDLIALAATPAAPTAAAPVVLSEPDAAIKEVMTLVELHRQEIIKVMDEEGSLVDVQSAQDAIESKLRSLLATATGLPAQAVEMPDFDLRTSKGGRGFVAWYFANVLQRYDYENYITNKLAADFACDLAKALSSTLAAPQAQADARDAALAASEQDALRLVRQAVRDFHYALDNRKHGGVAAGAAMNAIELALNMYWQQGQEADRRANQATQGGE